MTPGRRLAAWLQALLPGPVTADWRERSRVVLGAIIGIGVTAGLCRELAASASPAWPWLIAPMGASAVLVFGVPASPMAQPWSVVGGHTVAALVGVACARWAAPVDLAPAIAVGSAVAVMFALRCLHPPGGATALLAVLTGTTDPTFALEPVLLNAAVLTAVGMVYNPLTSRPYPHPQRPRQPLTARDEEAASLDADLDAVLARYNQVLDVPRDDLKALLHDTQLRGYERRLDRLRCRDIMSTRLITARLGTQLGEAWALFREHHIKALPVIDASGSVVGIVTPADFMRAAESGAPDRVDLRLRRLRDWTMGDGSQADTVGRIMTRSVRVARADRHLAALIPLFASSGHHHIPVVDDGGRLVGMVTQSDVVAALAGARPAPDVSAGP